MGYRRIALTTGSLPRGATSRTRRNDNRPITQLPQHPNTPSPTDPAWRADSGAAENPRKRRAAGQPFVARIERPGDALAASLTTPARPAGAVETTESRAAPNTIRAPLASHRAGDGVPAAQPTEALAGRHTRSGSAGKVRVIGAADQPRFAGARDTRLAATAILGARQYLRVDAGAACTHSEATEDHRPNGSPDAAQHAPPRVPAGVPFGQVVKPALVHSSSPLTKARDAAKRVQGPSGSFPFGPAWSFRARRKGRNDPGLHRHHAHRPRLPQYPEQHSGQVSPQLHESEQYPPVPAHGALQSLGFEQTPAPPGVPGDDAQHTNPLLHGCNVPVAQPQPM